MWFDAHARLGEFAPETAPARHEAGPISPPESQMSCVSQHLPNFQCDLPPVRVAVDANVATVPAASTVIATETTTVKDFPHGTAYNLGDFPKTWTRRVVSLAKWRLMTEWERSGPNGRRWNGKSKNWEEP